jgi:pilus assembly protein CpaF
MSSPAPALERPGVEFADVLEYLGPIRELLASPTISEVQINADLSVFVEEFGRKREVTDCRLNRADIHAAVKRIARADNTEPGENNPIINVRLGDGASRICIVLPPASPDGPAISIRKFRPYPFYGARTHPARFAAAVRVRFAGSRH